MNIQQLERTYTWGIKALLFAIPFVSLLVTRSMFFPFITGRNFAFRILVELAVLLWIGLMAFNRKYRPKLSLLSGALLVLLIVMALANTLGIFPFKAFWSNFERMEGFITFLHLGAYFFLLSSVFRSKRDWLTFLNVFVLAGAMVAIYGLFQKFGLVKVLQPGFQVRPPSTIGNPSYFAAYLILMSALALYLRFERKTVFPQKFEQMIRWIYAALTALFLILVYITGTRGAFLAVFVGLLLFALLYLFFTKKSENRSPFIRKMVIAGVIIAVVIPTGLIGLKNTNFIQNSELLSRYASISLEEGKSRFLIWNMAIEGFKERPLLGWGQEGFMYVFSKNYDPQMFDQEPWFDRAHNIIFDWLTRAGIIGLVSYLTLFGSMLLVIWRLWRRGTFSIMASFALIAGLVAYFFQNLFVFDNLNTYIVFFAILAYLHGLSVPDVEEVSDEMPAASSAQPLLIGSVMGLILVVPILTFATVRPMKQSLQLIDALSLSEAVTPEGQRALLASSENASQVADEFEAALAFNALGNGEIIEQVGQISATLLNGQVQISEGHLEIIALAIDRLENYLEQFPNDVRMRLFAGTLYNRAINLNPDFGQRGFEHISEVVDLNDERQLSLFVLAENYLSRGDTENAILTARRAVELAPEFDRSWATFGSIAVFARDFETAEEILAARPESSEVLEQVGNAAIAIGDLQRAIIIFEALVQRFPDSLQHVARLADLYFQAGLLDQAVQAAQFLAQRDPEQYAERTRLFIENIINSQADEGASE